MESSPTVSRNPPLAAPKPLWRNLSFTLMWTSVAASGFGDRMVMLAGLALLGGLALHADSTSVQASTQFWFFLAYIAFSVVGGWLADRLPRKWLLLACDESRSILLFASFMLLASASGPAAIPSAYHWRVWAILFAIGAFAAIFNPTRNAIIPEIVPRAQLTPANAIILGLSVIASMIGLLAGELIIRPSAATSVRLGLIIAASFYFASGLCFAFLRPIEHAPAVRAKPADRSLSQVLRYIAQHRRVLLVIGLSMLIWAAAAVVSSAVMGLGKTLYHLEGAALLKSFAQVNAAIGAGMLVGAGLTAAIRATRESSLTLGVAMLLTGLCIVLLATVPSIGVTYAAAFGVGLFGNVVIITVITLLQSLSPNYIRGRVMGISSMVNTLCTVAVYFVIWRMPDADRGIIPVLYAIGPALGILGVITAVGHLRRGPMHTSANILWHLTRWYVMVWHRVQWRGRHHLPRAEHGPVILAANHTAGIDPILIQAPCPRLVRWLMWSRFRLRILEPMWRSINPISLDLKGGDLNKLRAVVAALKEGDMVGLFPEGGLQRGHRALQPFQPGVAMIAKRSGATIVPVWIAGTPCSKHMFWHFVQPSRSTVTYGEPFTPDPNQSNEEVLADLRRRMLALSKTENAESMTIASRRI